MYRVEAPLELRSTNLELSKSDFVEAESDRRKLDRINDVEFNYWALLEAHREFVECSLIIANEWAHHYKSDSSALSLSRSRLGQRLDFFLVAFERYVGSTPGVLEAIGINKAKEEYFSPLYDKSFEYRLCCQMRNYASHKLCAGHGISILRNRIEEKGWVETSVRPSISVAELLQTSLVKEKFKNELSGRLTVGGRSIDMSDTLRKACSLVSELHFTLRDTMSNVQSRIRSNFDIYKHQWERKQTKEFQKIQLRFASNENTIPFEIDDDAAVESIRTFTAGIAVFDKLRVCSF